MEVEGAAADAGSLGDVLDAAIADALLAEHGERALVDAAPGLLALHLSRGQLGALHEADSDIRRRQLSMTHVSKNVASASATVICCASAARNRLAQGDDPR